MSIYYRVRGWNEAYETTETRKLKKLKWVAVPNKQDGDGYTQLLDHEKGPAHFGCWTAILQLASKCELRGSLLRKLGESWLAHDTDSISRITRMPKSLVMVTIRRCLDIGWLEELAAFPAAAPVNLSDLAEKAVLKGREGKGIEEKGKEGEGSEGEDTVAPAAAAPASPVLSLPEGRTAFLPPKPTFLGNPVRTAKELEAEVAQEGTTRKDVLDYFEVQWELQGDPLHDEWSKRCKGQSAPQILQTFMHAFPTKIRLPSHYAKARANYERALAA